MAAGPADKLVTAEWSRSVCDVMREEAESITALAGQLGLRTVFATYRLHGPVCPAAHFRRGRRPRRRQGH